MGQIGPDRRRSRPAGPGLGPGHRLWCHRRDGPSLRSARCPSGRAQPDGQADDLCAERRCRRLRNGSRSGLRHPHRLRGVEAVGGLHEARRAARERWHLAAPAHRRLVTGRTLSPADCLELRLVSRVVPADKLRDEAQALAVEIASNAPLAVQATKRMMRMGMNETFEANVHHVYLQLLPLFRSRDFKEGVSAFLEKREPEFEGR